jgi:predicted RNase H-like HicB family nuclease
VYVLDFGDIVKIGRRLTRESKEKNLQLDYTYWQENDGWFLGYLNDYPEHWTQGKTLKELEEMLLDLYNLEQEERPRKIPERKIGKLRVTA